MCDQASLMDAVRKTQPDEVYNLAAQSHVKVSYEIPIYTYDVCGTGTLRLLEAVRMFSPHAKVYQAGSSEMFGESKPPQNELTEFNPASPYAVAKVAAHFICANYRQGYGLWLANGILFNHESQRRGETFVTRKTTRAVARILLGLSRKLVVGNLDSARDWGYAPEYVEMMWRMLQEKRPRDYVIATGESHSVQEFINLAFAEIGVALKWLGRGKESRAIVSDVSESDFGRAKVSVGERVVDVASEYFRPVDPERLLGDSRKAERELGWRPRTKIRQLANIMVAHDVKLTRLLLEGTRSHHQEWREYLI